MKMTDILFSTNEYDKDGDCINKGVFLHFGQVRIKVSDTIEEFYSVVNRINDIRMNLLLLIGLKGYKKL